VDPIQFTVIGPGVFDNFRVRHNDPDGNGNTITYTLRIASTATSLAVSLASTGTTAADLADTVVIGVGEHLIDVEITKGATITTSPGNVIATVRFRST
jgi:hypothetical protein